MANSFCCVCDLPIEGEAFVLGGRTYDAVHYQRVARENTGASRPIILLLLILLAFAALVAFISNRLNSPLHGPILLIAGTVLSLVPAFIWLAAFYKQDRLEPEPKHYVLGVMILGALLAAAVGQPIIQDSFRVQDWLWQSPLISILGSIFVIGFVQEFLKYAAVRYTIYYSAEFDERVDGIIYAAAAGLGYATALNLQYIIGTGGTSLGVGIFRITITTLAQASFAGVTGYFLGRAKFENMGAFWLPAGLTLAAVLNGVVSFALNQLPLLNTTVRNSSLNIWYSLAAAAVVAGITFGILFRLIRRLNAETLKSIAASATDKK